MGPRPSLVEADCNLPEPYDGLHAKVNNGGSDPEGRNSVAGVERSITEGLTPKDGTNNGGSDPEGRN